jgi:hypothetical protein
MAGATAAIAAMPDSPAVFSLGFGERREPYIARTTNLRRRLQRMLAPEGALSRRMQLLPFVREIAWSPYGSEFEASLLLYREIGSVFSAKDAATVRKRLRLRPQTAALALSRHGWPQSAPAMQCSISSSYAVALKTCTPIPSTPPAPTSR